MSSCLFSSSSSCLLHWLLEAVEVEAVQRAAVRLLAWYVPDLTFERREAGDRALPHCIRRFLDAAELLDAGLKGPLTRVREATLFGLYNATMGVEWLRQRAGAQPGTRDLPAQLTDVDADVNSLPRASAVTISSRVAGSESSVCLHVIVQIAGLGSGC